ncbi:acyltransferase family protein [Salipiger sp. PrR002]|uniref:acyltransferase family protein n=1 Tax=Salipiger sp. PrR002 TaxID=2706489 RepID=UPI0013BB5E2C|nr:acyltransferase family protein [Salipiger sp. PrR002]NDW01732.1 acyltransferase [Salipiger sp. PrR002]NDW57831.1 acyltransferase [Salipiger sp. PrR004]
MIGYRRDIDGLRAVAVLPVVLFHADVRVFSGGFVGVDVFFVISGFLITTIIHREIEAGEFSILRFYERRARRILPALLLVIAVTLLAGYFLLMPADYAAAGRAGLAAALFVSNMLFWSETGYFSPGIYDQPLLHTWSLAIEEQFYIFFPPLMLAIAALRWRPALPIAVLTLLSLCLSGLTTEARPAMGYYLLPWRAWELGLGALVALLPLRSMGRVPREVMGLAGLVLIGAGVLGFDEATVFPGWAALMPVAGAAMIIAAGGKMNTICDRLLSVRPFVWTGLISYSLYLWHWPVIVFYQQIVFDRPDVLGCVLVVSLSFVLAWASWAWVEVPFRRRSSSPTVSAPRSGGPVRTLLVALAGITVVSLTALGVTAGGGLPSRLPAEAARLAAFSDGQHPRLRECTGRDDAWRAPGDPCLFGAKAEVAPTVALWGDSHAGALLPEVEAAARRSGRSLAYLARAGCLPVPETERLDGQTGRCAEYGSGALDYLLQSETIETVILVARYALASKGYMADYGLSERDWSPTRYADVTSGPWPEADRLERLMAKLDETVEQLRAAGRTVVIVYPIPEIGYKVPETLAKYSLQGRSTEPFGLPRDVFEERNAAVRAELDKIVARHDALKIVPSEVFCDEEMCHAMRDGTPLYYDDDHLSAAGAAFLGPAFDGLMAGRVVQTRGPERDALRRTP